MARTSFEGSMVRARQDSGWLLPGLGARTAVPELRRELQLFGQFVGDWSIFPPEERGVLEPEREPTGEIHVRWALGGTAVQDVWGAIDPASRRLIPEGTTIRFYDPKLEAWRSTWLSPSQRVVRRFLGRKVGAEIVLREVDGGERGALWIFSEIGPGSFRWRAEERRRGGGPRRITEELWVVRRSA